MRLSISRLDDVNPAWLDEALLSRLRRTALSIGAGKEIDLILVDDSFIRGLNRDYRGKDAATDVISFSYMEGGGSMPAEEGVAGEVYVSVDTVEKEAIELGVEEGHLFLRVVVHGLLHILGHDHDEPGGAAEMEAEEKRILGSVLGPPDIEKLFG